MALCISRRLASPGCFMIHFSIPVTQGSQFLPASVNYPAHLGFFQKIPVCLGQHPAVAALGAGLSMHLSCPLLRPSPRPRGAGKEAEAGAWECGRAQWTSAASCLSCKAVPSQLQALSIPGPARMLYCLFPSAGRCRCSTWGCAELLALGIRDERPVTPRFMGRVWEASMLGRFCILQVIFLCLIPHSCHPAPQFVPTLFLIPLKEVVGLPCHLRATLGKKGEESDRSVSRRPPATQLAPGVGFFLYFPFNISQRQIPWARELAELSVLVQIPFPSSLGDFQGHLPSQAHFLLPWTVWGMV